jgi:hypothetical protein
LLNHRINIGAMFFEIGFLQFDKPINTGHRQLVFDRVQINANRNCGEQIGSKLRRLFFWQPFENRISEACKPFWPAQFGFKCGMVVFVKGTANKAATTGIVIETKSLSDLIHLAMSGEAHYIFFFYRRIVVVAHKLFHHSSSSLICLKINKGLNE